MNKKKLEKYEKIIEKEARDLLSLSNYQVHEINYFMEEVDDLIAQKYPEIYAELNIKSYAEEVWDSHWGFDFEYNIDKVTYL